MKHDPTVTIIGAGQAGLAMSRCLTDRSIDHVLIDRGDVANSWRSERWDSLRLLTPNWLTRLPGYRYDGEDPDGYMSGGEVATFLDQYRVTFNAPVLTHTAVESIRRTSRGYHLTTTQGEMESKAVVVATGACSTPKVPALSADLPPALHQIAPIEYRNPNQIEQGRVLVVGASASGAQIASELQQSGREVTLAVGEHVRLPRTYRGMDIHWWMDAIGLLDDRYDEIDDIARARRLPSLQLVGSPDRRDLDLNTLHAQGVELVGRLVGLSGSTGQFSGSLANLCSSADLKLRRLLNAIDEHATERGLDHEIEEPTRPAPLSVPAAKTALDMNKFTTVVWATGFRPHYPWLDRDLLDRKGAIEHNGGVMNAPGMYVLGLPFTRRRKSSFIDGVGPDAAELSRHLAQYLNSIVSGCAK